VLATEKTRKQKKKLGPGGGDFVLLGKRGYHQARCQLAWRKASPGEKGGQYKGGKVKHRKKRQLIIQDIRRINLGSVQSQLRGEENNPPSYKLYRQKVAHSFPERAANQ